MRARPTVEWNLQLLMRSRPRRLEFLTIVKFSSDYGEAGFGGNETRRRTMFTGNQGLTHTVGLPFHGWASRRKVVPPQLLWTPWNSLSFALGNREVKICRGLEWVAGE